MPGPCRRLPRRRTAGSRETFPAGDEGHQAALLAQLKNDDPEVYGAAFYLAYDLFRGVEPLQERIWKAARMVAAGDVRPPYQAGEMRHTVARVKSQSKSGPQLNYHYVVTRSPFGNGRYACGCTDYELDAAPRVEGQKLCKHILAIKIMKIINREPEAWPELNQKQQWLLEQAKKRAAEEAALELERKKHAQEQRAAKLGAYGKTKGGTRIMEERQKKQQPVSAATGKPPTETELDDWFSY